MQSFHSCQNFGPFWQHFEKGPKRQPLCKKNPEKVHYFAKKTARIYIKKEFNNTFLATIFFLIFIEKCNFVFLKFANFERTVSKMHKTQILQFWGSKFNLMFSVLSFWNFRPEKILNFSILGPNYELGGSNFRIMEWKDWICEKVQWF